MQILLEQPISDHPVIPNIKRKVAVYGANINGKFEQIVIDAEVKYYNENNEDVSHFFVGKLQDWIINNFDLTTARDGKGRPLPNPQYITREVAVEKLRSEGVEVPEDIDPRSPEQKEEHIKVPSFDYFFNIIKNPKSPSLINILQLHIVHNDAIKFFDKMLNLPVEP